MREKHIIKHSISFFWRTSVWRCIYLLYMLADVCAWSTGVDIRRLLRGWLSPSTPQALGLNFLCLSAVPDVNTPKILSIQGWNVKNLDANEENKKSKYLKNKTTTQNEVQIHTGWQRKQTPSEAVKAGAGKTAQRLSTPPTWWPELRFLGPYGRREPTSTNSHLTFTYTNGCKK